MIPQDELEDLRALGEELAGAQRSPWEPRCIARAFAAPRAGAVQFTMQHWIDLEAIRSPLLVKADFSGPEELQAAAQIFGLAVEDLTPEEAAHLTIAMQEAVSEAFAMGLPMRPSQVAPAGDVDGFGSWLPIYTCLVTQGGIDPDAVMKMPVGRAMAVVATTRRNEGWLVAGTPYAMRDVNEKEVSDGRA